MTIAQSYHEPILWTHPDDGPDRPQRRRQGASGSSQRDASGIDNLDRTPPGVPAKPCTRSASG